MSIKASDVTEENWLPHLTQCRDNGTLARIAKAQKFGEAVLVKRSDGSMQSCTIVGWGYAGRLWDVVWGEGDDRRYKHVKLENLLEWNPRLDAAHVDDRERLDFDVFWTDAEVAELRQSGRLAVDDRNIDADDDDGGVQFDVEECPF